MNLKQCFSPRSQSNSASLALLALRLIAGTAFIIHGWGKIQNPFGWMGPDSPLPGILQALGALAEFGGGLAWVLGLVTPLASLGLLFTMLGATYLHAIIMGDPFVSQGGGAYELALVYIGISLVLMFVGPGKFSADKAIFGEK